MRDWLADESGRKGGSEKRPDTLRVCGIPCRWLAEERVSTKPSLLIAHTVFSSFGPVRNIELLDPNEELPSAKVTQGRTLGVAGPAALGRAGLGLGLGAGLALKLETDVMVRFGSHSTFCDAVKALARHAVKKEGSSSLARVQLMIDGGDYFDERNVRRRRFTREQRAEEERQQREREERRRAERERAERERKEEEERKAREEEERVRR
ncbi:unnamed protein product [Closterium sp. Yama58-4]|nr:unnamed protein product [Closterium sp. Yama58-4]